MTEWAKKALQSSLETTSGSPERIWLLCRALPEEDAAEILGATPEAVRAFREIARPDLKDWHIILLKEEITRLRRRLEVKSRLNLTYLKALNRAKGRVKVC
ncbi:MAG: hypothetical protein PWQ39_496 [Thermacetogenium sp.]|nr:hypothetical protein [Thermacetogenium sp.]